MASRSTAKNTQDSSKTKARQAYLPPGLSVSDPRHTFRWGPGRILLPDEWLSTRLSGEIRNCSRLAYVLGAGDVGDVLTAVGIPKDGVNSSQGSDTFFCIQMR